MSSVITQKFLDRIGHPELVQTLSEKLSGTELNSLLLEVFRKRMNNISPPTLLKHFHSNRFVKPSDLPVLELKKTELDLLNIFHECNFEPIELSPVTVVGTCSVVGPADQNKILSALRGTEVLADASNAMALYICDRKKQHKTAPKTVSDRIRLSSIQRHVRTQGISSAGFTPHFKIGCFVTSGCDNGSFSFEKEALLEHIQLMKRLYEGYYKVDKLHFRIICRHGYDDPLRLVTQVKDYIMQRLDRTTISIVEKPDKEIGYYKGLQYKVDISWKDKTFEIADGGFVDWTQKILQNKKERYLISGFGFEFMYRIVNDLL